MDELREGRQDILRKRKISLSRDESDTDPTPTKKPSREQVRPVVKTKAGPVRK
jgi:hypothetical protein